MCKVSVIMPMYNEEKYVEMAIVAVLSQTMRDFELILVDDGSTDSTLKVCEKFALRDKRITLIKNNKGGVSAARNTGISAAKGKYIYFTDADDYVEPDLLEKICKIAEENDAEIVEFGFYKEIYNSRNKIKAFRQLIPKAGGVMTRDSLAKNIRHCFSQTTFYISGHMFLRSAVEGIAFSDIPLAEDSIYVIKAFMAVNKIAYCQRAYYHYAVRIGSAVNSWQPRRLECDLVLMEWIGKLLHSLGCKREDCEKMLNDRCAGSYLNVIYNLSLPDCKIHFFERLRQMKSAAKRLNINNVRKYIYSDGDKFEKIKYFLIRRRLEILMLLFGRSFIKIGRK